MARSKKRLLAGFAAASLLCVAAALVYFSLRTWVGDLSSDTPTEAQLDKLLGGADVVTIIREADVVEAGRVELKEELIETRKPEKISAESAGRAKALMSDRMTYFQGTSMCRFDPGVTLSFRKADREVTLLICLKCGDLSVMQEDKAIGFLSFANEPVLRLVRDIFPHDDDIRQLIEEREAAAREAAEIDARWLAGMPKSIRPLWDKMPQDGSKVNLRPLQHALAREYPDRPARILALLTWYGSGEGAWSSFPSYESVVENLLLDYSTADLVAAIDGERLTERQLDGAARLFGAWRFSKERPGEAASLPLELRKTLLAHAQKSPIKRNVEMATQAFR